MDPYAFGRLGGNEAAPPAGAGDTVYLTAVDGSGLAVSLIQSLFEPFGSGVVPPGTGILLHSRGSLFTLDPSHPNALGPRKRPLHTLIPAMVMRDGRLWLSFGVMGGDLQPQGHVQVLMNLIEFGMTIQEAGEAARIRHSADGVAVESGISRTRGPAWPREATASSSRPASSAASRGFRSTASRACCWAAPTRARTASRSDTDDDTRHTTENTKTKDRRARPGAPQAAPGRPGIS